jgi:hypothetical protein
MEDVKTTSNNVFGYHLVDFMHTNEDFGLTHFKSASKMRSEFYAPQTKICESRTSLSECAFEALFHDS